MTASGSRPVMVLVTGVAHYHARIMSGMRRVLDPLGIPLLAVAIDTFASEQTSHLVLDLLRRREALGVVALADASGFHRPDLPRTLLELGTPTVTLGIKLADYPVVQGDNVMGMRALMGHVLDEVGVRRPLLVRGIPDHLDSEIRERVFREECERRGVAIDEELMVHGLFRAKATYDVVHGLLGRRRDFDAVVALNDPSAFGALSALSDQGLRVPEDVRVTGFDDLPSAASSWPPLTSVDQGLDEQGAQAATALLKLLAGEPVPQQVQVPSRLVRRTSTTGDIMTHDRACSIAAALQARAALQEGVLQVSWDMANCRTVEDVVAALVPCLAQLDVSRCFVGLDRMSSGADREAEAGDETTVLTFSYRDGHVEDLSGETFARHRLLPERHRGELAAGDLLLQPLSIGGRERGYLLYEINAGRPLLSDALRIELPRAIDAVLSSRELRDHAAVLERVVAQRTRELEEANAALQRSAMCDGLTGIANRRAFQQFLDEAWDAPDGAVSVALVLVDIDLFKAYNDRYGHLAGDAALKTVASCLQRAATGPGELACRFGGEEFAVLIRSGDVAAGTALSRRFADLLADAAVPHEASTVATVVTTSIGVAARQVGAGATQTDLILSADAALYRAKAAGRARIEVAERVDGVPRQRLPEAAAATTGPDGVPSA